MWSEENAGPSTRDERSLGMTSVENNQALVDEEQKNRSAGRDNRSRRRTSGCWSRAYGHIGFILPACVFVGLLIGSALDKWLGTKSLMLVGIILGSIAGFVELIRGDD